MRSAIPHVKGSLVPLFSRLFFLLPLPSQSSVFPLCAFLSAHPLAHSNNHTVTAATQQQRTENSYRGTQCRCTHHLATHCFLLLSLSPFFLLPPLLLYFPRVQLRAGRRNTAAALTRLKLKESQRNGTSESARLHSP